MLILLIRISLPAAFSAADSKEQGHLSDVPGWVTTLLSTWSTGLYFLSLREEGAVLCVPEGPLLEMAVQNT